MIQTLAVECLIPHPENPNHMPAERLAKLRKHLSRSGRYEPLVVRPHPVLPDRYEVINGHHRLKALMQLGHRSVRCVVWDINDEEARLCLATLNRLSGEDIAERRTALLDHLLDSFDASELENLLPDDSKQVYAIQRLRDGLCGDGDALEVKGGGAAQPLPVILDFVVDEDGARKVGLSLDLYKAWREDAASDGEALVGLASYFLAHCGPEGERHGF